MHHSKRSLIMWSRSKDKQETTSILYTSEISICLTQSIQSWIKLPTLVSYTGTPQRMAKRSKMVHIECHKKGSLISSIEIGKLPSFMWWNQQHMKELWAKKGSQLINCHKLIDGQTTKQSKCLDMWVIF